VKLITIKASHYCEKARWGLERLGIDYTEESRAPLLHVFRVRRYGGRTVPVLLDGETVCTDSTDILQHIDRGSGRLYPSDPDLRREVDALEELFDETLGPHIRRMIYGGLFEHRDLVVRVCVLSVPPRERRIFSWGFRPIRFLMRKAMNIHPASVERSAAKVEEVLARVDTLLADGRRYLVGDRFTAADLTFAALAAFAICPESYGAALTPVEELPAAMAALVRATRARPAGEFALRLYAEERRRREA
jgi:glutathione S-transferase